jgi:hypothetical protein
MRLTPIGSEFESIIAAVVFFLLGGVLSFAFCFSITNLFLCYKRRISKRHRHNSVDDFDYTVLTVDNSSVHGAPSEVVVVDPAKLEKQKTYFQNKPSYVQRKTSDVSLASLSTSSTNET